MDLVKFFIFLALVPYPLGLILTRWLKIPGIFQSLALGLYIFTLESYFLGLLGLYIWSIPFIFIQSVILWLYIVRFKSYPLRLTPYSLPLIPIIFIALSIYVNSTMLVNFGKITPQGISLYGAHFVDSTWHLSLINNLDRSLPPENPIFAGTKLTNYHYLVDLQISLIHRITEINTTDLYFRLFGPFYLLLLCWLVYDLGKKFTGKTMGGITALVLFTLGSNLYYLIPKFFPHANLTPSVAWVEFFSTKTVNYPLLVSLVLLLVFLNVLHKRDKLSVAQSIFLGLLSGCLLMVKSHTALVWIGALGFSAFFSMFRKSYYQLLMFFIALLSMLVLAYGSVASGNSILQIAPLWFIKVMYESPERLNNPDWELRRQTLLSLNAYFGTAKLYIQGLLWFIFINFGIFLPGIFAFNKSKLYLGIVFIGLLLSMLFIQRGAAWNSIQFIYPVFLALATFAAFAISRAPYKLSVIIFVVLFALSLPGNKYITDQYLGSTTSYGQSQRMIQIINLLKLLPPGTVFADNSFLSGSYIQAYSGHSLYLGDIQMLESLSLNYSGRLAEVNTPLTCNNLPRQVQYILLSKPNLNLSKCTETIISSPDATLYTIIKT